MNILIAEDEPLAAERLTNMLHACDATIKVIAQTDSVQETIQLLANPPEPIDLLLLDIQLADGKSFRILEESKTNIPTIFTTAFDQYAIQAFKFHSIDYLLKPIQKGDLINALEKFKKLNDKTVPVKEEIAQLRFSIEQLSKQYKQRFLVKAGTKLLFIDAIDAAYFFADGKTVYLQSLKDGRKHIVDNTLDQLEGMLDPDNFFRISRKFIVNLKSIIEIRGTNANLEMKLASTTSHELIVSRERATAFKQWLNR